MAEITNYKVASSPHVADGASVRRIMLDVLIALLPCVVCGVLFFGLYSLMLVVICVAACFASEQVYNLIRKKPITTDLSAVVTGVILGLNLPPRAPWYIPIIGGLFAIVIVKMLFGGLGKNFANPAAAARVFLLLAYSGVMTSFIGADISGNILSADGSTGATYLGGGVDALADSFLGAEGYWGYVLQLFLGSVGGSIGETSALAVLVGGGYLIVRRVIDWRIPFVYLLTSAAMVLLCYGSAQEILLQLFSGGLMFGAFFMATDYATSPKWRYNRVLFAFGLGVVTVLIRRFGSYPEGVSLAILFMNLLVPAMDKFLIPVRFGQTTRSGKPKPQAMKWGMRGLCIFLAAALAVAAPITAVAEYRRPRKISLPGSYAYVKEASIDRSGNYYFDVQGSAYLADFDYTQPLEYKVRIDADGIVSGIEPITQSTMGYTAELSLFVGKGYAEISALTDLSADSDTSATYTNTALRNMIEECYRAVDLYENKISVSDAFPSIAAASESELLGGRSFVVEGVAKIPFGESSYEQSLCYYVNIKDGAVNAIEPVTQSTRGYVAELSLFIGKTYEQIKNLTDLSSDSDLSATYTNTQLKNMLLECFLADDMLGGEMAVSNGYSYISAATNSAMFGGNSFIVTGTAHIEEYDYDQALCYYINIENGIVSAIEPITQSTMGYVAEVSLFIGKTYAEIAALTDPDIDAETNATYTNLQVKNMVLECFLADDLMNGATELPDGTEYVTASANSALMGGESFLAEGIADLYEYDYRQTLCFYINIENGVVSEIVPIRQSTMGYSAELSLFLGKTEEEISALTDLSADSETSATRTNTALKNMILECFSLAGGDAQ